MGLRKLLCGFPAFGKKKEAKNNETEAPNDGVRSFRLLEPQGRGPASLPPGPTNQRAPRPVPKAINLEHLYMVPEFGGETGASSGEPSPAYRQMIRAMGGLDTPLRARSGPSTPQTSPTSPSFCAGSSHPPTRDNQTNLAPVAENRSSPNQNEEPENGSLSQHH